jgi:hypothetical protein
VRERELGSDQGLYTREVVRIGYARRLGMLAAVATVGALATLTAPASALTVTVPTTLPGPLAPIVELPVGGSVSTGTGGDPIGVTVTVPSGDGIGVTLPGLPSGPALPVGPTGPVTVATTPAPVGAPAPAPGSSSPTASPSPRSSDPFATVPGNATIVPRLEPAPQFTVGAAPPDGAFAPAPRANVNATIAAQSTDSFLHRVPAIAGRLALWIALCGVVFVLYLLVGSTVRQHRRTAPRIS